MTEMKPGFRLRDRYMLVRKVGAGLAEVWQAVDLDDDSRPVAVKVAGTRELSEVLREAFTRETASLQRLRHEHVIELRDSGADPDAGPWLVLEWADGGSLADPAVRARYRDELALVELLLQCTSAVLHAHRENILHRDLKPANILFDGAARPLVADFNVAKLLGRAFSLSTVRQHFTWEYAAPEQRAGKGATERSDVYALGLIAAELMLGELTEDHEEVRRRVRASAFGGDLRGIVDKMLLPAEPKRPTAAEVVGELRALVELSQHTETVYLQPVPRALDQFIREALPGMPIAEALHALGADLDGLLHVEPEMRPDKRGRQQYVLIGRRFRYFAVPGDDASETQALTVTGLVLIPPERRDVARAGAVPITARAVVVAPTDRPPRNRCVALLADLHAQAVQEHGAGEDASRTRRAHLARWEAYLEIAREQQTRAELLGEVAESEYRAGSDRFRFRLRQLPAAALLEEREPAVCYVAAGGKSVKVGVVVDVRGRDLQVRPHDNVAKQRDFPAGGRLLLDLSGEQWTLRRQEDALRTLRIDNARRRGLADLLADPGRVIPPRRRSIDPLRPGLDESNRRAVEVALGTDSLCLIQGPPGTGKTTVISELIGQICKASPGAQILLVSQSNVAVDNVLERLQDLLPDVSMVRLGRTGAIASTSRPLELQVRLDALSADVFSCAERAHERLGRLRELGTAGLEVLVGELEQPDGNRDAVLDAERRATALVGAGGASRRELVARLRTAQRLLASGPAHLDACATLQLTWMDRARGALDLERHLLRRAQVVAGTCVGFMRNHTAADLPYDWVIVDEAGRASAPELLVPLVRGQRFVLVGDHRQLPPVLDDEVAALVAERVGGGDDLLRTSLFQELFEAVHPEASVRLVRQYRMHPEIGELISSSFYPDGLQHGVSEADRARGAALLGSAVRWLDTSQARDNAERQASPSRMNPLEVRVIVRELKALDDKTRGCDSRLTVGILTAYAAQAERLRSAIAAEGGDSWTGMDVQVMTVDSSQGKEFDVVFYSAVRSNPGRELGFLADERRLNVALSRAREALTIVGNNESLREAHHRFGYNPFRSVTEFFRKDPVRRPMVQVDDA
jgi:serine/threonine-protein kinase